MKNLLRKEILLTMHPTAIIFLSLSAFLAIPNYPYYLTFFYTGLAIFFTCLNGRENHDVFFSMSLPIAKRDTVKARFIFAIVLQIIQMLLAIPFAVLRASSPVSANQAGMDANIAFFGWAFFMLGLFNLTFFSVYYRNVNKVGFAFFLSSVVMFCYMAIAEACAHVVPFFRDVLDTRDPQNLPPKLAVLLIGAAFYALLTFLSYRRACRDFEHQDILD